MADMTDPRAVRSRAALLAVATELITEASSSDITVTDVAARAGVSRPTFRQHFADVPALLAAAVTAELQEAFARSDEALAGAKGIDFLRGTNRRLIAHIATRRDGYREIMRGAGSYQVLEAVTGYVGMRMRENVVGEHLWGIHGRIDEDTIDAAAISAIWRVTRWLDSDLSGPDAPDAFAERLTRLMLTLTGLPDTPIA